ncbi:hypothetical protein THTE_0333 [Thermogutta terrifontis]|uniref:Uncharacterized protein n=1 Tax=Thermogutta terrifontis TaxID=1331910 RepID=A0A286RAD7_9BACT|nr:hypothetical protein THTE_0333 [Thermogutta terrifontis]
MELDERGLGCRIDKVARRGNSNHVCIVVGHVAQAADRRTADRLDSLWRSHGAYTILAEF